MHACKIGDDYALFHGTVKSFKRFFSWIHKKIGWTYLKGTFIGMSASVTSGGYTILFSCLLLVKKGCKPSMINNFTFTSRQSCCITSPASDAFGKKSIMSQRANIRSHLSIQTTFQATLCLWSRFSQERRG